jgi:hypothetical protein
LSDWYHPLAQSSVTIYWVGLSCLLQVLRLTVIGWAHEPQPR